MTVKEIDSRLSKLETIVANLSVIVDRLTPLLPFDSVQSKREDLKFR